MDKKYDLAEIRRKLTADTIPQAYIDWLVKYLNVQIMEVTYDDRRKYDTVSPIKTCDR
jgi:hypothetical protein